MASPESSSEIIDPVVQLEQLGQAALFLYVELVTVIHTDPETEGWQEKMADLDEATYGFAHFLIGVNQQVRQAYRRAGRRLSAAQEIPGQPEVRGMPRWFQAIAQRITDDAKAALAENRVIVINPSSGTNMEVASEPAPLIDETLLDGFLDAHPNFTIGFLIKDLLGGKQLERDEFRALHLQLKRRIGRGELERADDGQYTRCTPPDAAISHLGRIVTASDSRANGAGHSASIEQLDGTPLIDPEDLASFISKRDNFPIAIIFKRYFPNQILSPFDKQRVIDQVNAAVQNSEWRYLGKGTYRRVAPISQAPATCRLQAASPPGAVETKVTATAVPVTTNEIPIHRPTGPVDPKLRRLIERADLGTPDDGRPAKKAKK